MIGFLKGKLTLLRTAKMCIFLFASLFRNHQSAYLSIADSFSVCLSFPCVSSGFWSATGGSATISEIKCWCVCKRTVSAARMNQLWCRLMRLRKTASSPCNNQICSQKERERLVYVVNSITSLWKRKYKLLQIFHH